MAYENVTPEWLNSLPEQERKAFLGEGFGLYLHDSGADHVACFWWRVRRRGRGATTDTRQGSMLFLNCGPKLMAVTADHVYQGYLEDKREGRAALCMIGMGGVVFDPEARLISRGQHRGIDIATFSVKPDEVVRTGKRVVLGLHETWPPPPKVREGIFFGGFPAQERYLVRHREYEFGLHSGMPMVTSVTEHQITCRFDRANHMDIRGYGLPPAGYDLGGVSGGPMLSPLYVDGRWTWRLVGVISEAHMTEEWEQISAVRAHFIQPDGRVG
jgi:hypothetical protein